MLTESFIAATLTANKAVAHASASLRDVGIFLHEFQPQNIFRHGYKKSSSRAGCVAISETHIFAAQTDKAVVNVYSRDRGNQEATVPFPERIHSLAFAHEAAILVLGTERGNLILWEIATGRLTTSAASHLQPVSSLCITPNNEYIISGSDDSTVHVWSLLKLVSFPQPVDGYGTEETSKPPEHTFSGHRTAISTIACGHSSIDTNFAISCSTDGTCFIWHIESCQILRTLLLPTPALSIAVEPADRTIYFGCKNGQIQAWSIFQPSEKGGISWSSSSEMPPIQLLAKDSWAVPNADIGTATCLTLSYDGTSLLSGHSSGVVIRWDVAKHRIVNEVANLGQPVTNIEMLEPTGFPNRKRERYRITNVVKPNLGLTSSRENGSCGVPAQYSLHLTAAGAEPSTTADEFEKALIGPGLPQGIVDNALRSLAVGSDGDRSSSLNGGSISKIESLEDEVSSLKQQLAALHGLEEKRNERKLARVRMKDDLDLEKRKAYFEAKKNGEDGDAAMKEWEEKRAMIDVESDREYLADKMDVG